MGFWQGVYASGWQGTWALLPVPALFLAWLLGPGRRRARAAGTAEARFVWGYCVVFAIETLIDPLATGPLGRWLGLGSAAKTGVMLLFVLLGDFRVFALVFGLADLPHRWLRAAVFSFVVPFVDLVLFFGLLRGLWPGLPDPVMWLVHELAFLGLALALRSGLLPGLVGHPASRRGLRRVLAYVALYYGLWATADVLILYGVDLGWALRVLPNQLYYACFVPFVWHACLGSHR